MDHIEVKFKLLSLDARLPELGTEGAAAYDLFSSKSMIVSKGSTIIPVDIAIEMPRTIKANVRARSGNSLKGIEGFDFVVDHNGEVVVSGTPNRFDADVVLGLIDSDYRGAIGVIVKSNEDRSFIIPQGARIAQLEFSFVPPINLKQVAELSETERGEGGFGHTGTN